MARPASERTPAPLLLSGPAGAPPGGGALLGLRNLLQGTSKPKEPASCLLKEKERKAAPPAATVPGPGLESAGPPEAPAGAVVGGGSPRGRPGAVPGPGLLAPLLWERTLPFGDVEYVDLDAFLLEHGLPPSPPPPRGPSPSPSPARTPVPSPGPGSCGSASPRSSPGHAPGRAALGAAGGHRAGLSSRDTPSPVDPDTVEVLMTFEPDPADLALSSIPGHETFDPRRHRFSEEELKPQPIMKKARKIQVPEEQKVQQARLPLPSSVHGAWTPLDLSAVSPTPRMRSIGAGGTRTTRRPSGLAMPGGSRRTRSRCGRPSWRRRTPFCGRRWWPCARSCPTTAPCCPATKPSTGPCEAAAPHLAALSFALLRLVP
nr:D site-binding protein isoform X2 [Loxodonta africana]